MIKKIIILQLLLIHNYLICEKIIFPDFLTSHKITRHTERLLILKNLYEKNDINKIESYQEPLIPLKIHQIWIGPKPLPEKFKWMIQTWKNKHPLWEYKLWTNEDLKDFNLENQLVFDKTTNWGVKADIFRYEILYRNGGVYIDIDFECIKSLDVLNFHYNFYGCLINNCDTIANGFIAVKKKHPILLKCIQEIKKIKEFGEKEESLALEKTGPHFFTNIFFDFISNNFEYRIIIFPSSFFFPFPGEERNLYWNDNIAKEDMYKSIKNIVILDPSKTSYIIESINQIGFSKCTNFLNDMKRKIILSFVRPETFAIHYWATSWQTNT